jgi:hypothetical protein
MTEEDISFVASNQPNPISRGLLQQFRDEAATCLHEDRPTSTDYRKAENPYIARYGEATWRDERDKEVEFFITICLYY